MICTFACTKNINRDLNIETREEKKKMRTMTKTKEERVHGDHKPHVLLLPYPSQGHINPMHQFAKRLVSKGLKATLILTTFISNSLQPNPTAVELETISDGYDNTGFAGSKSIEAYLRDLELVGCQSLAELIHKLNRTNTPIDCLVYDAFLPWCLDVAKNITFGTSNIVAVPFFTQACAINSIYYHVHNGLLSLTSSEPHVSVPGLPVLEIQDLPSFFHVPGQYPAYFELVLNQFCNVEKADLIFVNTFQELEIQVVEWMVKQFPVMRTIGPTLPSVYLDKRIEDDEDYELNLYNPDSNICINWLNERQIGSVIYVSFGSMAELGVDQMEELAYGLEGICTNYSYKFLWVVRGSEQNKLPNKFKEEMITSEKGLIVQWSPQLQVLGHKALGCFVTHCGWNSTLEALCLGVPMVGMPQWTDQPMDAKLVEDVWKVGVRAKVDDKGIARRDEIEKCVKEVMEGERARELKREAIKWRELARKAVDDGGSSDRNIDDFIAKLMEN